MPDSNETIVVRTLDPGSSGHRTCAHRPPRTPARVRLEDLPFRRARRALIAGPAMGGLIVSPGHPGRASIDLVDASDDGVFVADPERTLGHGSRVRIGLPSAPGAGGLSWAWADVKWRGRKYGRDGVGLRLTFDRGTQAATWRQTVGTWLSPAT